MENNDRRRKEYEGKRLYKDETGYRTKRRRDDFDQIVDEPVDVEKRLSSLILKVADKVAMAESNLGNLVNVLETDYQKYTSVVLDTLKTCITELPQKTEIYSTLVGLLNAKDPAVGKAITDMACEELQLSLNEGRWRSAKLLMRFLGCLVNVNVILPSTLVALFAELLNAAGDANSSRNRSDFFVFIVLAALPYVGGELNARAPTELQSLMERIENYFMIRAQLGENLDLLKPFHQGGSAYDQVDTLALLWIQTKSLKEANWEVSILPKPQASFVSQLSNSTQHELPKLQVPQPFETLLYPMPKILFMNTYDADGKLIPAAIDPTSIDYFVLHDVINDIFSILEINRKECARILRSLRNNFVPDTFLPEGDSDDQKTNGDDASMEETPLKKGYSLYEILIENLISHLFRLPSPEYKEVYVAALFIELCRGDPSHFPPLLGRTIQRLYARVDKMDVECVYRFGKWFAHHLSNFGYVWNWKEWEPALSLPPEQPQQSIIREVLDICVRFSYYDRIRTMLPDSLAPLVAPEPPAPVFRFENPLDPLHNESTELLTKLRRKVGADEILQTLENFGQGEEASRELFIECALLLGSKSFSHVMNVVERYLSVFQNLNSTPEAKLHTVRIVARFWNKNKQFMGILMDKLLNYRVVDANSIVHWTFETEQVNDFSKFYVWEILKNTLNKVNARVVQTKSKLEQLQQQRSSGELADAEQNQNGTEQIQQLEHNLEVARREQKEVFLMVFQKFTALLAESGQTLDNWKVWWIYGWYREMLRGYYNELRGFLVTLETIVYTPGVPELALRVFGEVKKFGEERWGCI
ncbi:uncharacterized protein VTP21DRAFT_5241 [Calcarisporiella thermophila]|uniref:uncharacterized protein n=1 Tax=Calcarisporiella thermophila TaxID=911321 RepID=UPI0037447DEC